MALSTSVSLIPDDVDHLFHTCISSPLSSFKKCPFKGHLSISGEDHLSLHRKNPSSALDTQSLTRYVTCSYDTLF